MTRDYRSEYDNYHSQREQKNKRNNRNKARRKMVNAGKIKKRQKVHVHHRDGNPNNNAMSNLSVSRPSNNMSFPRNRNAQKA